VDIASLTDKRDRLLKNTALGPHVEAGVGGLCRSARAGACIDMVCALSGISIDDGWTVRAAGVRLSRSCGVVLALAASAPAGALPLRRDDQQSAARHGRDRHDHRSRARPAD